MKNVFLKCGFKDVSKEVNFSTGSGLIRGDVLLNEVHHVAMYIGNGKEVEASINERGGATGGTPGDQTGEEVLIKNYRNYPWDCILRYVGNATTVAKQTNTTTQSVTKTKAQVKTGEIPVAYIKKGSTGVGVTLLQMALNLIGNYDLEVDGEFGPKTHVALKSYQRKKGRKDNGICGLPTFKNLMKDINAATYKD